LPSGELPVYTAGAMNGACKTMGWVVLVCGCGGAQQQAQPSRAASPADPTQDSPRLEAVQGTGSGPGCEDGRTSWLDAHEPPDEEPPEEHAASIKEQLNRGTYLNDCNIESSAAVEICAAIAEGQVAGVTVSLDPGSVQQADCVAEKVREMSYPEHPELVVARTAFAPTL
jgi:hypothetical protein